MTEQSSRAGTCWLHRSIGGLNSAGFIGGGFYADDIGDLGGPHRHHYRCISVGTGLQAVHTGSIGTIMCRVQYGSGWLHAAAESTVVQQEPTALQRSAEGEENVRTVASSSKVRTDIIIKQSRREAAQAGLHALMMARDLEWSLSLTTSGPFGRGRA